MPKLKCESEDPCACIVPLKQWIKDGSEEECRPCLLAPLTQWYRDELEQNGLSEMAKQVEEAGETEDPEGLSALLDNIKKKVPEDVKERLKEFDCQAQLYEEE